jgi:hypothetical protein
MKNRQAVFGNGGRFFAGKFVLAVKVILGYLLETHIRATMKHPSRLSRLFDHALHKLRILVLAAAALLAGNSAGLAQTTVIPIANYSFESPTVTDGNYILTDINTIANNNEPGWISVFDGASDQYDEVVANINPGVGVNGWPSTSPPGIDGNNYCRIFINTANFGHGPVSILGGCILYQDTGVKYLAGVTYQLTAAFGLQGDDQIFATNSTMVFYNSNLTPIASKIINPTNLIAYAFTDSTLTYSGTGSEGGNGDIVIGFCVPSTTPSSQSLDFDNVRLVENLSTSFPQPQAPGTSSDTGYAVTTLTPVFSWTGVAGANRYGFYISHYPYGSTNIIYSNTNLTGTSFQIPNGVLQATTKYRWNMTAFDTLGNEGGVSGTLYFQTAPTSQFTPSITTQPQSQSVNAGSSVTFSVVASGQGTLNYQWQLNGQNISGATSSTLTLNSVTAANSGGYSVVVSNPYGYATSATASLAVLTDGANGNTPVQISVDGIIVKESGKSNLVIITHGYIPPPDLPIMPSWVTNMADAIQAKVSSDWQVVAVDWALEAWYGNGETPDGALNAANIEGTLLGKEIAGQSWQQVHLIAHSAGSGLIQAIANQLKLSPNPPAIVQLTFLDPYLGAFTNKQDVYGLNANWSDCYFTEDWTGPFTSGNLYQAYNEDVSWVDPAHTSVPYLVFGGGEVALSSHEYPHDFYIDSITNTDPNWCGAGSGFDFSPEVQGAYWSYHPVGGVTYMPCSPPDAVLNPSPDLTGWEALATGGLTDFSNAVFAVSSAEVSIVGDAGFAMSNLLSVIPHVKSGSIQPKDQTSTNTPAWLAVGVSVTNAVNFVQFNAAFTDMNSAQGLLTVYWNTNQIGMVDERVAATNSQTYRFELPGTVSGGLYTLSFRLDSFGSTSSSIVVTNVATGFVGVNQPVALGVALFTNSTPILQLTGASNYNYLVESSTNLVDWTPTALLVNSNGTAFFADKSATNSPAKFYRAIMP